MNIFDQLQEPNHHDQSTILQRCKTIIQELQEQILILETRTDLLQTQKQNLVRTLTSKEKLIEQLQERLSSMRTIESMEGASLSEYSIENRLSNKSKKIGFKRQESEQNFMDDLDILNSKYLQSPLSNIMKNSCSDYLTASKKTLLSVIQNKDEELNQFQAQNKELKKEYLRISRHLKKIISGIATEYKIEPQLIYGDQSNRKKASIKGRDSTKKENSVSSKRSHLSQRRSTSKLQKGPSKHQGKQLRSYTLNQQYSPTSHPTPRSKQYFALK